MTEETIKNWELVVATNLLPSDSVRIDYSPEYRRKECALVKDNMEQIWNSLVEKNNRIYNASKFRLNHVELSKDGILDLKIGVTDYKETVCTNFAEESYKKLKSIGKEEHNNEHACFADTVGVTSIVHTKNDLIIAGKRSMWLGESKGKKDLPGGHAEPGEMLKANNMKVEDMFQIDGKHVAYEIYHSIVREVRDEVNIPESCLSWPLMLGIARDDRSGYKPGFIFYIRCSLSSDEIKKLYQQGGAETDETTELIFLKVKDVKDYTKEDFEAMRKDWSSLSQCALTLFQQLLLQDGAV